MPVRKQIEDQDIPDNEEQQDLFLELLEGAREPRVFVIRDARAGSGKTLLLRKLLWSCRSRRGRDRLLTMYIDLEDQELASEYHLVRQLAGQVDPDDLPNFDRMALALDMQDPTPFTGRVTVAVDARDATLHDNAQLAQIIINNHGSNAPINVPALAAPQWVETLRPRAERAVVNAFLDDLRALPDDRRAAIFIDSVDEKAPSRELSTWVLNTLLEREFLDPDRRPKNALLCVAGRDLPDYAARLADDFPRLAAAPSLLTTWQPEHTDAFLRLMLGRAATDAMVQAVHEAVTARSIPLRQAYEFARGLSGP
jgi:hypothetical protein